MARYMILYNATTSASEQMAQASPEEMQASMQAWIAWKEEATKTAGFDFGMPLQAVSKVTASGVTVSECPVSGYSIMEGDSPEAITALLQTHPHLQRPGATIDVLEMLSMPGM